MFSYKQKRNLAVLDTIATILSFLCLIVTLSILLLVEDTTAQNLFLGQFIVLFLFFISSTTKVILFVKEEKLSKCKSTYKQPLYTSKYMSKEFARF